jgi:hypothetical protein
VKIEWFKDIKDPKERDEFKKIVSGSKIVLDKAIKICYNYINSAEKVKLADFDSPSWAYRQAYLAGRNSAFHDLIEVLTVDDE